MKLILCLFISLTMYAQEYTFDNVISNNQNDIQTLNINGQVILTNNQILIITQNNLIQFDILGQITFYIQNQTIYRCKDQNQNTLRIFWIWSEQQRKYVDMIYQPYPNVWLTFCLTKKIP